MNRTITFIILVLITIIYRNTKKKLRKKIKKKN